MDKQRISNILSSIQMNPRDRKDFIDELSKLGQGGQGGGEVTGEHPVRIIELTQENAANNVEVLQTLNSIATYSTSLYINGYYILCTYHNGTITAFVDNKLKQYVVNFETGEITESLSIDISTLAGLEARIAALEGA